MGRWLLLIAVVFSLIGCSALKKAIPWDMTPGTIGSVKFVNESSRGDVALGFERISDRLVSVGTANIAVLFVDFSDSQATADIQTLLDFQSESTAIFQQMSYGRLNFHLIPLKKWLRMSKPYGNYHFARGHLTADLQREYMQEAINLADQDFDFSSIDSVVVIANPVTPFEFGPAFCGNASTNLRADGRTIKNGVTSGADGWGSGGWWLSHESGHTMGLVDLYAFDTSNGQDGFRYTGDFSWMGRSFSEHLAPEALAWERWLLGWLDDNQIVPISTFPATVAITPIETKGGIKAAIVPISSTKGIVIESRHSLGYDNKLTREGILVYTIDTTIDSGYGTIVVQGGDAGDLTRQSALLRQNESISVSGYTVTVTNQDSSGETVSVSKN